MPRGLETKEEVAIEVRGIAAEVANELQVMLTETAAELAETSEELRKALGEVARLEGVNKALTEALGARHKELRAKRGQAEFYAETLRGLGADPFALWVEALADDSTGYRKRFKPDEGDASKS